jgi:hypothetical protein
LDGDPTRSLGLISISFAAGSLGWNGSPIALPVAMLFPALWALSPTRTVAACAAAGYFLSASRGLPEGIATFYESQLALGVALWLAASLPFVVVHAIFWTPQDGWLRALRYLLAASIMSVPPCGIVGWAHPITAAGILFPGWKWAGLAATAMLMLAMTTRRRPFAAAAMVACWAWSAATWTASAPPEGWTGMDTHFGGAAGHFADYTQHIETVRRARSAAAEGRSIVVLPESAGGLWTPTVDRIWRRELEGTDFTIIAGAAVVNRHGYDNVMLEITAQRSRIIYSQRMPVPISMWQPWLAWFGMNGGARMDFFANPITSVEGTKVAPLICYELLVVWPIIQSMLRGPQMMVAIGNGWWTTGTDIIAVQRATAAAWSSLFNVPSVVAFNR